MLLANLPFGGQAGNRSNWQLVHRHCSQLLVPTIDANALEAGTIVLLPIGYWKARADH
jgi:hypothetical protein